MKEEEIKAEVPIIDKEGGMINEVVVSQLEEKAMLHKASTLQTTFTTIKMFVGISILASPHAFSNSGVLGGILGITLAAIFSILTVSMQSDAAIKIDKDIKSYSELGFAWFGSIGKLVVDGFILFAQLGIWIAYLIFNGTQIDQILWLESQGEIWNHKNFYIVIAVVILSPVWWIKHLKNLSWIAFVSLAGILLALGTILYYDIKYI